MKKLLLSTLFVSLCQLPLLAAAHHSAAQFDFSNRDAKVEGIVKEFTCMNPHTTIVLEVTDAKGTRDIAFAGHSRNNYYRSGWRPNLISAGDRVTLEIAPTRDGSDGGYARSVITQDGTRF